MPYQRDETTHGGFSLQSLIKTTKKIASWAVARAFNYRISGPCVRNRHRNPRPKTRLAWLWKAASPRCHVKGGRKASNCRTAPFVTSVVRTARRTPMPQRRPRTAACTTPRRCARARRSITTQAARRAERGGRSHLRASKPRGRAPPSSQTRQNAPKTGTPAVSRPRPRTTR